MARLNFGKISWISSLVGFGCLAGMLAINFIFVPLGMNDAASFWAMLILLLGLFGALAIRFVKSMIDDFGLTRK